MKMLSRRMLKAHICWRKSINVLFCVLVVLFCFSIYNQKTANLDERETEKLLNKDTVSVESNKDERTLNKLNEVTDTYQIIQTPDEDEVEVDMVYTWVNGSDPAFIQDFYQLMRAVKKEKSDILALNRYTDWGTLKYSLRSVERFAPWIRHVYIVTNGHIPNWMALDNPRISIVTHRELFTNKSDLPAFTSPAIESHIHKIHGLSRRFIYMNDDIILTSKLQFSDFYTERDGHKLRFVEERPEMCNKLCLVNHVNNGICEENCTTASCEFDGDDCRRYKKLPVYPGPDKDFMYDSWEGSIRHTYFLLNKKFGPQDRFIPEHAAIMYDKDIFGDLIASFPKEWNKTSSTKVRHHLTIQPEFAYYSYLKVLEQLKLDGVKTTTLWTRKNYEKIDFILDNRSPEDRKMQFKWCRREIYEKQAQYLVFSDHYTNFLYDVEKKEIQDSLTKFLQTILPKPSQFEKVKFSQQS